MSKFIPKTYWNKTHRRYQGLQAVGYVDLGRPFNDWMYKVREKIFLRIIKGIDLNKNFSILDIGSGNGFYPMLWQRLGFKDITASDFSEESFLKLKKLTHLKVLKIDITAQKIPPKQYDLISCFDMLYHIVDDDLYCRAFKNIAQILKPGGILIFSENLLPREEFRGTHQVCRPEKFILMLLQKNQLKIINRQPIFFLMNTPITSQNPLLKVYWFCLLAMLSRLNFLGGVLGPLLYPLELRLGKIYRQGPSTEMIVCQKLSSEPVEKPSRL